MSALPKLNFPPIRLRARRRGGGEEVEIWDPVRGIYLVLTPEEWVRQHLIAYLVSHCGVQPTRIVEEYAVPLNGQPQRADVVVVGDDARPLLLAECISCGTYIHELFKTKLQSKCEEQENNTYFRPYIDIFDISHGGENIYIRPR